MKLPSRIQRWSLPVAVGFLLVAPWLSHSYMADRLDQLRATEKSLDHARTLASDILQFRQGPIRATDQSLEISELSARIETAVKTAGLPVESLIRVAPQSARRLNRSDYLQHPLQVSVSPGSLQQFQHFISTLMDGVPRLEIAALQMDTPRGKDSSEWAMELTIVYSTYAPLTRK